MKTIAVLTDFSPRATNAAKYALQLAAQLNANILLQHNFLVPSMDPLAAQIAWPMEDYEEIKKRCDQQLRQLATKLKAVLNDLPADAFRPAIHCNSSPAKISLEVGAPLTDKEVILVVIANHHKGLSALLMGDHLQEVLDEAALPVLVIPEHAEFRKIKKIAFATDLEDTDLEVINSLTSLARPFIAELMLAHICPEGLEAKKKVDNFLHEVTNKINYPHIYYRNVCEKQISKGLAELEEKNGAELLVMVHRSKGFLDRLFNSSFTHKVASDTQLPLLVYPYPTGKHVRF